MSTVEILKQVFEKAFAESGKIKPGDKVYLKGSPDKCYTVSDLFTHKVAKLDDEEWAVLDNGEAFWQVFLLNKWE